jgi:hypothetical protein
MSATANPVPHSRRWSHYALAVLAIAAALAALYTWVTLTWSYSEGERAGYVQKFSRKGWICKTWEGELAMVALPGTLSEKFAFSVRDPGVAEKLQKSMGKRVALSYQQHVGVPSTCFAESEYFIVGVQVVE